MLTLSMCYSAESSLGGFTATWALGIFLLTMRGGKVPWRYNVWTAGVMMLTAFIQLLEFRAWKSIDDPPKRQRVARLIQPTLLLQPAANFALCAYALRMPVLYVVAAGYAAWCLHAFANQQPHADIRRGTKGHLAWYGDVNTGRAILDDRRAWAYMVGLFAPLALAIMFGNARYGITLLIAFGTLFSYSMLAYPLTEVSSMWCFWGLAYTGVGVGLNF